MDKNLPLVSIVSGYYNREDVVYESVQSLMDQTYPNLEIIIFDDCSPDNTFGRLQEMAEKDSRIKLIRHEKNKSFVVGLMDAIADAKGEYIAIHGSGDISYPERIAKQAEVLNTYENIGVVGCHVESARVVKTKNGTTEETRYLKRKIQGDPKTYLLTENPFTHGEVMYRRSVYDEVGGYRRLFTFTQDLDLWCRMSFVTDFYIVEDVLYKRFLLSDGASVKLEKKIIQKMLREFSLQNHELKLQGKPELIEKYNLQSLFYFRFTKRFLKVICPIIIQSFKEHGRSNPDLNMMAQNIIEKKKGSAEARILDLLFFKLPESTAKKLVDNKLSFKVIRHFLY